MTQKGIPLPSLITHMAKGDLIPLTNGKEAEAVNTGLYTHIEKQATLTNLLGESIRNIVDQSGAVGAASAWETLLSEAASATFRELFNEVRHKPSSEQATAFAQLLATVAIEATGQKNARDNPLSALTEGLLDLVLDHLKEGPASSAAEEAVRSTLLSYIRAGSADLPSATISKLNRVFQIELLSEQAPQHISRGLIITPTQELLQQIGLEEGWERFIWKEVLHDPLRLKREDPKRADLLLKKDAATQRIRPMLVEVGADCDHAQRKPRSHRFLLAAEVPGDLVDTFLASSDSGRRSPYVSDAIEVLGPWPIGRDESVLAVCCKRFWSYQLENIPTGSKSIMRLRGSLVDHLLHRYSTLATRPGFINLRSIQR